MRSFEPLSTGSPTESGVSAAPWRRAFRLRENYELLALVEALEELAKFDAQKSKIVELRYFGGLSAEETARVLGVSEITVKRHWRVAKLRLHDRLGPQ